MKKKSGLTLKKKSDLTLFHSSMIRMAPLRSLLSTFGITSRKIKSLDGISSLASGSNIILLDGRIAGGRTKQAAHNVQALLGKKTLLILCAESGVRDLPPVRPRSVFDNVLGPKDLQGLRRSIRNAAELLVLRQALAEAGQTLNKSQTQVKELQAIGVALSGEIDLDRLLTLIVTKARQLTTADAGSLYLVAKDGGKPVLKFKISQNDSLKLDFQEFTVPFNRASIAGYSASTGKMVNHGDIYHLPATAPYAFSKNFDESTGYRTKSMLVIPMKDHHNKVMGVIQLINRKREAKVKLTSPEQIRSQIIPFDSYCEEILSALGGQAGVAIENQTLYGDIANLFAGFVKASVSAIEQRDPTTSGHSQRVAKMTVGLAKAADNASAKPFKNLSFSRQQLQEIEYAGLLHDFGKVGVRESVLVKAEKLYPHDLQKIKFRFELAHRVLELEALTARVKAMSRKGGSPAQRELAGIDAALDNEIRALQEDFALVQEANKPTVLAQKAAGRIDAIGRRTYKSADGKRTRILDPEDVDSLKIPKGSLNAQERREIESHVTHTYAFLKQIPWTDDLARVPEYAYGHHEKLNGSGYPRRLYSGKIAVQTRMMTVADIFDALAAADRPYKKAVPLDRAFDILKMEVKDGNVDGELLDLFIKAKVFKIGLS